MGVGGGGSIELGLAGKEEDSFGDLLRATEPLHGNPGSQALQQLFSGLGTPRETAQAGRLDRAERDAADADTAGEEFRHPAAGEGTQRGLALGASRAPAANEPIGRWGTGPALT